MTWWHYLLLSNLYLILFYGFYLLLLRRETFFQLNRIYLVSSAVMAFLIPVIHSDWVRQWFITQKVQQTIYNASPAVIYRFNAIQPSQLTMGQVLGSIYLAGILVLSVKLIWQLFTLSRIINNSAIASAWSFFKKIKVDEDLANHEVIMAHEEVHARQWHSADVLLIEVIMIINWFNPVVYFYRRSIKHIHEFIADRDALKTGTSKADYAMLLVSQTFNAPVHDLLNPFFNNSVLKQRIIMLQKNRSGYGALIKYGFSAPLFALMLALSSATINNSAVVQTFHREAQNIFETNAPSITINEPLPPPTVLADRRYEELKADAPGFKINTDLLVRDEPKAIANAPRTDSAGAENHNEVFTSVEKLPEFPGGVQSFYRFLQRNLRYPAEAVQNNKQGRVNVTFVVRSDGSLSDIRSLNNKDFGLGEEAARVITASPKWIPGEQNGHKVDVQYTVPVVFSLANDLPPLQADTAKGRVQHITLIRRDAMFKGEPFPADSTRAIQGRKVTAVYTFSTSHSPKTGTPLFMIDGKEAPAGFKLNSIENGEIKSVAVYKRNADNMPVEFKADRDVINIILKKDATNN